MADLDHTELAASLERVFRLLRRISPPRDLSLTAASALRTLDQDGPHRLTELAGAEGVTQPAMTQLVSRLERDGLARRNADPADGRAVVVEITKAGRALLRHRREARVENLSHLLAALSPADAAAIAAALPAFDRLTDLLPQPREPHTQEP